MCTEVGFAGVSAKPARVSAPPLTPPPLLTAPLSFYQLPGSLFGLTWLWSPPAVRPAPLRTPRLAVVPRGYGLQTVRRHQLRGRLSWLK